MHLKYIKALDGVRGIAAIMVMLFHFFSASPLKGSSVFVYMQSMTKIGQTGVVLFFVLSGFLITRILIATKNNQDFFRNFYARRAFRIFPLYYLFLIIYYFIVPLINNTPIIHFSNSWYVWIYLQNFADTFHWQYVDGPPHYWSLAVEEHFYLFWPLIVFYVKETKLTNIIYMLILISWLTRIVLIINGFGAAHFTFSNVDALAIGALLALKEWNYGLESFSVKYFFTCFSIGVLSLLLIWVFVQGESVFFIQVIRSTFLGFLYYSFIGFVIALNEDNFFKKILTSNFLLFTGKISYGLYVYHQLIIHSYFDVFKTGYQILDFVICMLLVYGISSLSFYLFELQLLKFKKYFTYKNKVEIIS